MHKQTHKVNRMLGPRFTPGRRAKGEWVPNPLNPLEYGDRGSFLTGLVRLLPIMSYRENPENSLEDVERNEMAR